MNFFQLMDCPGPDPDAPNSAATPEHMQSVQELIPVVAQEMSSSTSAPTSPTSHEAIHYELFKNEFTILGVSTGVIFVTSVIATMYICRKTRELKREAWNRSLSQSKAVSPTNTSISTVSILNSGRACRFWRSRGSCRGLLLHLFYNALRPNLTNLTGTGHRHEEDHAKWCRQ